ncbi:MAG: OmpH family outer membrane protein [Chitinivibrionales bacterium]|nr:OmpH family outer membrane protein [Chitinivibrionales bacterium]
MRQWMIGCPLHNIVFCVSKFNNLGGFMLLSRHVRIAVLAVLGASSLIFAELKIGFINSQKIFKEYEGTKEAQEKFDKEAAKWEQEATDRQKEIKELQEQLEKQSLMLSSERRKELEDKIKQKYAQYQEFLQQKFGQEGEVVKKNVELTKPIIEKMRVIIDKIAKEEHYDYIFDESAGGVIFAKKGFDLTGRVLKVLNAQE